MKKYIIYICIVASTILLNSCNEDTLDAIGTGTVTGKVIVNDSSTPIDGATVSVVSTGNSAITNASGDFVINNVPEGQQSLSIQKEGYLANYEGIVVVTGGTINVVAELSLSSASNRPPEQPVLMSPVDNSIDLGLEVELTWTASDPDEDALTYKIELRNDQNSDVEVIDGIEALTYTLSGLNYGFKYFWQVSASDGINSEVWSIVNVFETSSDPVYRYLFVRNDSSNNVIYSADIVNNTPIELQLTLNSTNSWRPRKNLSTGLIAFLRSVGSETHLFTMNPDGSDVQQISNTVPVAGSDLEKIDFSWSNNGAKLLYTNFDKLYSINKDGSGLMLVYQTLDGSFISECDWAVDESIIALKVNNVNGYGVSIYTIDMSGVILNTVLSGVNGAAGGLNISIDKTKLIYTHDISGYESPDGRQLDTHIFMYNFNTTLISDLSGTKPIGFLDLDPRFSPNEAEVIYTHTSNDGVSENKIQKVNVASATNRTDLFSNAKMPDWE